MKFQTIFLFAAVLTVAVFAGQGRADEAQDMEEVAEALVLETAKKLTKECYVAIKANLLDAAKVTMTKYLEKLRNNEPLYNKKDKKFKLSRFFTHSLFVKTTKKSLKDCVNNAEDEMNTAFENSIERAATKAENYLKKVGRKAVLKVKNFFSFK